MDPARGHDGGGGANSAEDRRSGARGADRAGRAGAAPLSGRGAARARRSASGRAAADDAAADLPACPPSVRRWVRGLRAVGRDGLERVRWEGGEIAADHLLLHEGVIPNVQASLALGVRHEWDEEQLCWRPCLDAWGRTSLPGIAVAGDGGGIAGAAAAALSGRLAALDAALALGRIGEGEGLRRAAPLRAALARERALRPFLDRLYRPPRTVLAPAEDEVVACRCEEVRVAEIRRAIRLGVPGPNQMKAFTRCGMGPCQGRICGPIVAAVMAEATAKPIAEIGTWRPRAPWKPLTVGALAELALEEACAASTAAIAEGTQA